MFGPNQIERAQSGYRWINASVIFDEPFRSDYVCADCFLGISRSEERWLFTASFFGRTGYSYHYLWCPSFRTKLRGYPTQQQWGWASLSEAEALYGHSQPPGRCGVVEDLPRWSPDGWVPCCQSENFCRIFCGLEKTQGERGWGKLSMENLIVMG